MNMSLFLFETKLNVESNSKGEVTKRITNVQEKLTDIQSTLIEVQVAKDLSNAFFIIETENEKNVSPVFEQNGFNVELSNAVRLIGENLEDVKRQKDNVNYLVEWNLPENLTMEQYLNRKEKNSVKYADVPEVSFARTYVCEDMTKCLCFYDAPNQETVERAREAVSAPIDVITELNENK